MAKSAKRSRAFTKQDAINLHVDANKSDPFALQRMTQHLNKFPRDTKRVAEEAQRILDARASSISRTGAEWIKPDQEDALVTLKIGLIADLKPKKARRTRKPAAVMQAAA